MTERNELPVEFSLTDQQNAELEVLVNTLIEKCREFEAPVMVAICVENTNDDKGCFGSAEANYFNGERTPDSMAFARLIIDKNISSPVQLLALMASK